MIDCPHRLADGEVRRTAVNWLSGLHDDDLCDFLPQLVQSLRHDCFEACPMASLLLSRAVRSPRIAHHLYWWVWPLYTVYYMWYYWWVWSLNTVLCILYVVLLVGVVSEYCTLYIKCAWYYWWLRLLFSHQNAFFVF